MKKILIIILLFASLKSFSQAYTPINFDTSCYWVNSCHVYIGGITECQGQMTSFIEKDTIINSTTYFKMSSYFNYLTTSIHCLWHLPVPGSLFVREDTTLKQIIAFGGLNPEYVLLDFELNVGDTIFNFWGNAVTVDSISMDTINNIPVRKQWYNIFGDHKCTIEGIGNTINFPFGGFGEWGIPYVQLQCYSKNGITQYFHYPQDSPCVKNAPLPVSYFNRHNISQNYSDNILSIKNMTETSTLSVYNLLGNLVYSEKINDVNYAIELSSVLQNGFYIVSVNDGKSKSVLKVVVR